MAVGDERGCVHIFSFNPTKFARCRTQRLLLSPSMSNYCVTPPSQTLEEKTKVIFPKRQFEDEIKVQDASANWPRVFEGRILHPLPSPTRSFRNELLLPLRAFSM